MAEVCNQVSAKRQMQEQAAPARPGAYHRSNTFARGAGMIKTIAQQCEGGCPRWQHKQVEEKAHGPEGLRFSKLQVLTTGEKASE